MSVDLLHQENLPMTFCERWLDYSPVAIRPIEELVVRRNLPRATSDLLELAGITN